MQKNTRYHVLLLDFCGHAPSSTDQIPMAADIAQKITLDFDKHNKKSPKE